MLTRSVVLVGLMGSGKSSVGRRLAKHLGVKFADLDEEIVQAAAMTITEIFEQYGEEEFRALEARVLKRVLKRKPLVIATGGGVFVYPKNRELIKRDATSIWLDASLDTLWDRVKGRTHRPLLLNDDPKSVLKTLMDERRPSYEMADFHVISQSNQPHEAMVKRICKVLGSAGIIE